MFSKDEKCDKQYTCTRLLYNAHDSLSLAVWRILKPIEMRKLANETSQSVKNR